MAGILTRWAGQHGVEIAVDRFESQCANGYLIARLLHDYGVIDDKEFGGFQDEARLETRVDNFANLERVFEVNEIKFDRKLVSNVMLEERGAAQKLIFALRLFLEPDSIPEQVNKFRSTKPRKGSFMSPKKSKRRVPLPDPNMELAVRGKLTNNDLELTLKLAHFEQRRIQRENAISDLVQDEKKELETLLMESRKAVNAALIERKERLAQMYAEDSVWIDNENVKRNRIGHELEYELTCQMRAVAMETKSREDHRNQVVWGTEAFERNLKRLGLDDNREQSNSRDGKTFAEIVQESINLGKVQDEQLIQRLKLQRQEAQIGQKERQQRRNKVLTDQLHVQREVARKLENERLVTRLEEEAAQERKLARKQRKNNYRIAEKKRISIIRNRISIEQRDAAFRDILQKDKTIYHQKREENIGHVQERQLEWNEASEKKLKQKHVKAYAIAAETFELIVGLVFAAVGKIEEDQKLLEPQDWRDMKAAFIAGDMVPNYGSDIEAEEEEVEEAIDFGTLPHAEQVGECYGNDSPLCHNISCCINGYISSEGSERSRYDTPGGICILTRNHQQIAESLYHQYGFTVVDVTTYLEEAQGSSSVDGEISERDQLLLALGRVKNPEASAELVNLILLDINANPTWYQHGFALCGAPNNVLQAELLLPKLRGIIKVPSENEDNEPNELDTWIEEQENLPAALETTYTHVFGLSRSGCAGKHAHEDHMASGEANTEPWSSLMTRIIRKEQTFKGPLFCSNIIELSEQAAQAMGDLELRGKKLIDGSEPPKSVESPEAARVRVLNEFQATGDREALEAGLWDICFTYSKISQSMVEEWRKSQPFEHWRRHLVREFIKWVECEMNYYSHCREIVKTFYTDVVQDNKFQCEMHDSYDSEKPCFPKEAESHPLSKEIRQAYRSIEMREERGENMNNPFPDETTRVLTYINNRARERVHRIARHASECLQRVENGFEDMFKRLEVEIKNRITVEDASIRTLVKEIN